LSFMRGRQTTGKRAPFKRFHASDTVAWFESRGVKLKTEADGRMFPVSDSSQTIIDCLMNAAKAAGVKLRLNCGVDLGGQPIQPPTFAVIGVGLDPTALDKNRDADCTKISDRVYENGGYPYDLWA